MNYALYQKILKENFSHLLLNVVDTRQETEAQEQVHPKDSKETK